MKRLAAIGLLLCAPGFAQLPALRVYSEFQRIDPWGGVVAADRARDVEPREILSPGLVRNSWASYHVAVTVPPGRWFTLYVGQNPEGFLGVSVCREIFVRRGEQWIPDGLEAVELPYTGRLPDPASPIPGQTTVVFLMDLKVPFDAAVRRTKLEPQLYVDGQWVTYPMEVRILPPIVPTHEIARVRLASIEQPADATVREVLRAYICGDGKEAEEPARGNLRWIILRNASQDVALARSLEKRPGERLVAEILALAGGGDGAGWRRDPVFPEALGPEWCLRLRDKLYRMLD